MDYSTQVLIACTIPVVLILGSVVIIAVYVFFHKD